MTARRDPSGGLLAALAAAVGLCCGLPLLLGAGIAIGATGLALGSSLLVAAGAAAIAWAWHRRRKRDTCQAGDQRRQTPPPRHSRSLIGNSVQVPRVLRHAVGGP